MRRNKQRGFVHITGWDLVRAIALVGVCGWALIDAAIWFCQHVTFGWQ